MGQSIQKWLEDENNRKLTLAVLTPRNVRGYEMVDELRKRGIEVIDSLLNSTSATRAAASALSEVLRWLAEAHTTSRLSKAYQAWRKTMPLNSEEKPVLERAARQLGSIRRVEDFVAPMPGSDWLENSGLAAQRSGGLRTVIPLPRARPALAGRRRAARRPARPDPGAGLLHRARRPGRGAQDGQPDPPALRRPPGLANRPA